MRALALALVLAGCAAPLPADAPTAPTSKALRFRACQALPPALPEIRTIEALKDRHDKLDLLYRDCAERMRVTVEAYERTVTNDAQVDRPRH